MFNLELHCFTSLNDTGVLHVCMICQQMVAVMKGQIQSCIMKLNHSSFVEKCPFDRDLHQSQFAS
jgi:hypothetical protein